jgi:hypothetical protein
LRGALAHPAEEQEVGFVSEGNETVQLVAGSVLIVLPLLPEGHTGGSRHRVCLSRYGSLAYHRGVTLDFSRPGKPTDNAFIESFNGKFRAECLNGHWFMSLDDARRKMRGLA